MTHATQQGPAEFLQWLAALPIRRDLCVECGAGRAEMSALLNPIFNRVVAVDTAPPSAERLHIPVLTAQAEALPFSDSSVDLLFSMQAAHQFDLRKHADEAQRVLRPGGVFAIFAWGEVDLPHRAKHAYAPVLEAISPYWEAERDWVVGGYQGFTFPGLCIDLPRFHLTKWLTPEGLETEMASWSAIQSALASDIEFPEPRFASSGLDETTAFPCRWPIVGQVFRY